jgi:dihydrodipicolinate synthase/N-acetylneuraminate lyase
VNRDSVDWKGYIPAITTPFSEDGALDLGAWRELCDWMVAEGMHGIAVAGTTGEWFSLEPEERIELFRAAAEVVAGRITVLGGCMAFTPREVIRYAEAARDAGLDGILLTPPPYIVPSERELVAWYRSVSDAVDIPICVYNWPRGTNVDMGADLLTRIAEIPNVVAIKNSTGDFGRFVEGLFAVRGAVRYFGVPMNEAGLALLREGADGTLGAGAVLGRDQPGFFDAAWAGDTAEALRLGARDRVLFQQWINDDYSMRFGSPQTVMKAALNLRGLPGGWPRPPLLPLTDDELGRVRATLAELGLLAVGTPA